jgi:CBS domain-containing protein
MLQEDAVMQFIHNVIGNRQTVVVDPATSVRDAARLMSERGIGGVPVVEGPRLVGIFTERDIMARVVAAELPPSTPVGDVMSTDLVVADVNEGSEACLRRMQQAKVRHVIVLRDGQLAGIVSLRDLLAVELDEKEQAITLLNAYVHYIPVDLGATKSSTQV